MSSDLLIPSLSFAATIVGILATVFWRLRQHVEKVRTEAAEKLESLRKETEEKLETLRRESEDKDNTLHKRIEKVREDTDTKVAQALQEVRSELRSLNGKMFQMVSGQAHGTD